MIGSAIPSARLPTVRRAKASRVLAGSALLAAWTLAAGCARVATSDASLETLFQQHRWFELGDAVTGRSPAFYRGAVACAFSRTAACEDAFASVWTSPRAAEAHELLAYQFLRLGRYRDALAHLDAQLALLPGRPDLVKGRTLMAALATSPPMDVQEVTPSTLRPVVDRPGLWLPLAINGHEVAYFLDTGMNIPLLSAAEASQLGLRVFSVGAGAARLNGNAGGDVAVRMAVADTLTIGSVRLRSVTFLIVDDAQPPFDELPIGRRGGIGLPILMALGGIRWGRDHSIRVGEGSPGARLARDTANLCFDHGLPLVRVRVGDTWGRLYLDTGAEETELYPLFAREIPNLGEGRSDSLTVGGLDGDVVVPVTTFPDLPMMVGGLLTHLRPARVQRSRLLPPGQALQHGNLGTDLLDQATEVFLDFRTMQLRLR